MPLWKVHYPVGAYSAQDKRNSPKCHRDVFKDSDPKFYVVMILRKSPQSSFYVGGASHRKFVRLKLEHMARTCPPHHQGMVGEGGRPS